MSELLKFERDERRERHAREFKHFHRGFPGQGATLAGYFEPDPDAPPPPIGLDPDDDDGEYAVLYNPCSDGKLYRIEREGERDVYKPLSFEQQCETMDVLPEVLGYLRYDDIGDAVTEKFDELVEQSRTDPEALEPLIDLAKQHEIWFGEWLESAARIVRLQSWLSANYLRHWESIEGDYENFDAFEADWLRLQLNVPRYWTRMGLNILAGVTLDDYSGRETAEEALAQSDVPEELRVTEEDYERAKLFLDALAIDSSGPLSPTLADVFC